MFYLQHHYEQDKCHNRRQWVEQHSCHLIKKRQLYITCEGSTWQNMEIFSLTAVSRGVEQRHIICQRFIYSFIFTVTSKSRESWTTPPLTSCQFTFGWTLDSVSPGYSAQAYRSKITRSLSTVSVCFGFLLFSNNINTQLNIRQCADWLFLLQYFKLIYCQQMPEITTAFR